ncbi:RNase P subunit RPR2 [Halalkalibacter oceani]
MFLSKLKKAIGGKELTCSNCSRTIKTGDKLVVRLTMPPEGKRRVGILDKVISHHADDVLCEDCNTYLSVKN